MPIGTRPFEFNRLESSGYANAATACISDTEWADGTGDVNYLLINKINSYHIIFLNKYKI